MRKVKKLVRKAFAPALGCAEHAELFILSSHRPPDSVLSGGVTVSARDHGMLAREHGAHLADLVALLWI